MFDFDSTNVTISFTLPLPFIIRTFASLKQKPLSNEFRCRCHCDSTLWSFMILGRHWYKTLATTHLNSNPFRPLLSKRTIITTSASWNLDKMPRIDLRTPNFPDEKPHAWPSSESWPAAKVRETFVKYFTEAKPGLEHTFWPSSNVIPFEDPTLLFANAVSGPARRALRSAFNSLVHRLPSTSRLTRE